MTTDGKYYEYDFEPAVIQLLEQNGWTYTYGGHLHRNITEPLYEPDLRQYLQANYPLSENDVNAVIAHLRNESDTTDYLSARSVWNLVTSGYDYSPESSDAAIHIDYIDFDNPENNSVFRCVNQFEMQQGNENRRPDIMLMVNGIPLCIIELKNPGNEKTGIGEAHYQICTTYRESIPALMKFAALAVISDGANTRLGSQFTPFEYFYAWKKVEAKDNAALVADDNEVTGLRQLDTMVKGALRTDRLLEIYRDYVFFYDTDRQTEEKVFVARYPQFFGTKLMVESIAKASRATGGDGKGGTYFGATGCGKTKTMVYLARQLMNRQKKRFGVPTVLIIVDRNDLSEQAQDDFCSAKHFLGDQNVRVFESNDDLGKVLRNTETGGLYITTIQKFTESTGLLSPRGNIICMSDEAHRTQNKMGEQMKITTTGDNPGATFTKSLAQYLHNALPNATYVGFTGTPIEDTYRVFGGEVDRYTMTQAQKDKITVPISYSSRLAQVFLDREEADKVEAYYQHCREEGATETEITRSKQAMASIKSIIMAGERLQKVAADIVAHYEDLCDNNPDLVQKAMIVCLDREVAWALYNEIKAVRENWTEKVVEELETDKKEKQSKRQKIQTVDVAKLELICTPDKKDPKEMRDMLGDDKHRKTLAARFKDDKSNFRIVIVVDMWITGFDVPSLAVLYNDKPLTQQTLIQTISRVNRRYKNKEFGLVVDYLGIRNSMKEALKKFDSEPKPGIENEEIALGLFKTELGLLDGYVKNLDFTPFWTDNPLERLQFLQTAAEFLLCHSVEGEEIKLQTLYKQHVRRMRAAFNIVHNCIDQRGEPLLDEEDSRKAQGHMAICAFLSKMTDSPHDVRSMNKQVERMVAEAIRCNHIYVHMEKEGAKENIFSQEFIEELEQENQPATQFELLVKLLRREIREYEKTNRTRAEHFAEMLAKVIDEYNSRTFSDSVASDTIDAISDEMKRQLATYSDKILAIADELKAEQKRYIDLGITFEDMPFYDILVNVRDTYKFEYEDEKCKKLAKLIREEVNEQTVSADFLNNDSLKDNLRSDLRRLLRKNKYPPTPIPDVVERVREDILKHVVILKQRGHNNVMSIAQPIVLQAETVKVEAKAAEVKSAKVKLNSEMVEPHGLMKAADSGMDNHAAKTWQCDRKFTPNTYDKFFHQALDMDHVKIGIYRVMNSKGYNGQRQFDKVYHWFVVLKVLREIDWIDDEFQNKDFYKWLQLSFGCKFGKGNYDKVDSLYKETKSKLWKENMPHGKSFVDLAAALRRELRGNEDKYKVRPDLYIWHQSEERDKN